MGVCSDPQLALGVVGGCRPGVLQGGRPLLARHQEVVRAGVSDFRLATVGVVGVAWRVARWKVVAGAPSRGD